MSWERHGGLRAAITQLAAQLMYGQEVKQYFTAKRLAAKRLLGQAGAKNMRYRPRDLPSNGEIKQALLELVSEIEGDGRTRRLFAMRVAALEVMEALPELSPRLIGSVATGHVRSGSDIDLHVFAWDAADVESRVKELGWVHEVERVSILKHGKVMEFTHVHVPDVFPIELTVYPPNELRNRPRSSTDGKPIVRLRDVALRKICEREHPDLWRRYLADGSAPTLEEILAAEEADDVLDVDALDADAQGDPGDLDTHDPWDDDGAAEDDAGDPERFDPREDLRALERELASERAEREPRIRRPPARARRRVGPMGRET
ncbi:MAG: nucleotide-binding enzyme [Myxococcales bacterium]|nr:nucleotide-binding enzyme [Myxococcales bacterium]